MAFFETSQRDTRRYSITICLAVFAVLSCLFLVACQSDSTVVGSNEARSPDGNWKAITRTISYGGPGTAAIQTVVYLQPTTGATSPVEILLFNQNAPSIDLSMNWLTPAHLEVTYRKPAEVDFQAIKCSGIEISLKNLSGFKGNGFPNLSQ